MKESKSPWVLNEVALPAEMRDAVDRIVQDKRLGYENREAFVKEAVRDLLVRRTGAEP